MDAEVIYTYTLQDAIGDGVLVEVLKDRWATLSSGKTMVCTMPLYEDVGMDDLQELWDDYVAWCYTDRDGDNTLGEIFSTTLKGKTVWVIEDGEAFTFLYPEDY